MTINRLTTRRFHALRSAIPMVVAAAMAASLCGTGRSASAADPIKQDEVEKTVREYFATKPHYQKGDLISRADVEPLFDRLVARGFSLGDAESRMGMFLPHRSFLVTELSTPDGRAFMRKVSQYPGVYDRLERLSWMPAGRQTLRDLIRRPDGPEMLKSMTSPEGASAVEKILGGDVHGANFQLPTGHIHTEQQLIEWLRELHQAQSNKGTARGPNRSGGRVG